MHHANTVNESYAIAIFFQADTPLADQVNLQKSKIIIIIIRHIIKIILLNWKPWKQKVPDEECD
jgi:hypothetical protein